MNKDTDRDLLLVSVFTFLTVSLWIFFKLIETTKTTTVTSAVAQIITPLNPKIDTETVAIISSRSD